MITEAQQYDQLTDIRELVNIVASIDETQPAGYCIGRLTELVDGIHARQEQIVDGLEQHA